MTFNRLINLIMLEKTLILEKHVKTLILCPGLNITLFVISVKDGTRVCVCGIGLGARARPTARGVATGGCPTPQNF